MKKAQAMVFAVLIIVAFTISIAFAEDIQFSGFLGGKDVYGKLTHGPKGKAKYRWIKPGEDFKKYDKFMIDSVIFYLAGDAYKGIDPEDMKELADSFNKEIVKALKDKYPIVSEPGPDVARISIAITNVKTNKPVRSTVSSVVPIGLGISLVKKGTKGEWTGGGETGIEVKVTDSLTDEVILMAVDERKAAFEERFSKFGAAKDAFKFWAARIASFVDETKGISREGSNK